MFLLFCRDSINIYISFPLLFFHVCHCLKILFLNFLFLFFFATFYLLCYVSILISLLINSSFFKKQCQPYRKFQSTIQRHFSSKSLESKLQIWCPIRTKYLCISYYDEIFLHNHNIAVKIRELTSIYCY